MGPFGSNPEEQAKGRYMRGIIFFLHSKFKAQFSVFSHIGTYVALFFIYSYSHELDLVPLAVYAATQPH